MTRFLLALLVALPLLTAPIHADGGCCSDEACCAAGCTNCKH
jgi:hypothetical protein